MEVSLPGPAHTLPGHPMIQCEAPTITLNGWFWEVGCQSSEANSLHFTRRNSASLNEEGEVNLLQRGVILTLIHSLGPPFFQCGDPSPH